MMMIMLMIVSGLMNLDIGEKAIVTVLEKLLALQAPFKLVNVILIVQ